MSEYVIWWLSQEACETAIALGAPDAGWPDYILAEFESRTGRPGRGRLWISAELSGAFPDGIPWHNDEPKYRAAGQCGGIVIRAYDVIHVLSWPGFITDGDLRPINPVRP